MSKKWVYRFEGLDKVETYAGSWDGVKGLLGDKDKYLSLGDKLHEGLCQVDEALQAIEGRTGEKFGDPHRPMLLSYHSRAKFSVLNISMNNETVLGVTESPPRFLCGHYCNLGRVDTHIPSDKLEEELTRLRRSAEKRPIKGTVGNDRDSRPNVESDRCKECPSKIKLNQLALAGAACALIAAFIEVIKILIT